MKTKTINYDPLVTTYNGEVFEHGEVVYEPNICHNDMTTLSVNFRLAVLNESAGDFTDELMALLEKYAQ